MSPFGSIGGLAKKLEGAGEALFTWKNGLELCPNDFELSECMGFGLLN